MSWAELSATVRRLSGMQGRAMYDGRVAQLAVKLSKTIGFRTLKERTAIADAVTRSDHRIFIDVPGFAARGIARRLFEALRHHSDQDREIVRRAIIDGSESDLWKRFSEIRRPR